MAKKITELSSGSNLSPSDIIVVVKDPATSPVTHKVPLDTVPLYTTSSTPANSTITVEGGKFWFDSDYIYVSVANNIVKRVSLSSF